MANLVSNTSTTTGSISVNVTPTFTGGLMTYVLPNTYPEKDRRCKHWRGPRSKIRCELPENYKHFQHFGVSRGRKYMWEAKDEE